MPDTVAASVCCVCTRYSVESKVGLVGRGVGTWVVGSEEWECGVRDKWQGVICRRCEVVGSEGEWMRSCG